MVDITGEDELRMCLTDSGIYSVGVEAATDAKIMQWIVYEVTGWLGNPEKTRHLSGYMGFQYGGRASTPIMSYDHNTRTATTASGRKYLLMGGSGHSRDAEYVWNHFAATNGLKDVTDVSAEYETVLDHPQQGG
jgi:ATP-dependent Lon protease